MAAAPFKPSTSQQAQALDDLLLGINEWRNIQDVVRITFKAFHDVLRQQGESIKAIERTLDTKAGRPEVSVALQQKATASEMASRLAEVCRGMYPKFLSTFNLRTRGRARWTCTAMEQCTAAWHAYHAACPPCMVMVSMSPTTYPCTTRHKHSCLA